MRVQGLNAEFGQNTKTYSLFEYKFEYKNDKMNKILRINTNSTTNTNCPLVNNKSGNDIYYTVISTVSNI
jgi:hypothetical protein